MEFFGMELTESGELVEPGSQTMVAIDEDFINYVQMEINKRGFCVIGRVHTLYTKLRIQEIFSPKQNLDNHPFWLKNIYNDHEELVGYQSIEDAIENNINNLWRFNGIFGG